MKAYGLPCFAALMACVSCSMPPPAGGGGNAGEETVVSIESGGELVFQPGALSSAANVTVEPAGRVSLPLGVEPVGDAIMIRSDQAATRPMTIRLPIPEGQDPELLDIYQLREDGGTKLLSTEVEGDFLVAATDHFTITPDPESGAKVRLRGDPELDALLLAIGVRGEQDPLPNISPPRPAQIVGPAFLAPGQSALYMLKGLGTELGESLQLEWNLFATGGGLFIPSEESSPGGGVLALLSSRSARIDVAQDASGRFDLTCSYVDPASGSAGFVSKAISIQSASDVGDLILTFLTGSTERVVGEQGGGFLFGLLADAAVPVTYTWDYGTGNPADAGSQTSDSQTVRTPAVAYDATGTFTLTVTATGADGATGEITVPVIVREDTIGVIVEGPGTIDPIAGPFDSDAYTVIISNGTPPFRIVRTLLPGGASPTIVTSDQESVISLALSEPGSYLLSVTATDAMNQSAVFTRPLTVTGGQPMSLTFAGEVAGADVDQIVAFAYTAQGGLLVVNGVQAADYRLEIDWGDGRSSTVEIPSQGTKVASGSSVVQSYDEPGTYIVEATLFDAGGGFTSQQFVLEVVGETSDCPVPCTGPSDCMAVGAAACIDGCCFECETSDQCPGDLVCDASLQCVEPCAFCCSGDALCDSGDGCADPDCDLCIADEAGACVEGCEPPDPDCIVEVEITSEGGVSASSVFSDGFNPGQTLDGLTSTSWFSDGSSGGDSEAFTWVRNQAANVSITRVETAPEAFEGGGKFGFRLAQVLVFDVAGNQVFATDFMALPGQRVDLDVTLPAGTVGHSVQLILVDHQDPSCGGFSEFRVFGLRPTDGGS